ncbi:hypothetical protein [Streptomyces sp. bgisy084]|uniref:hypothetical protein n=1 Tax=unclassified Streptomyces TaxID=2593676 RepID=UPI003D708C6C
MSRTDKTKPLWVRHVEHHPRPLHDHRYGACDLPPHPTQGDTAPAAGGRTPACCCSATGGPAALGARGAELETLRAAVPLIERLGEHL